MCIRDSLSEEVISFIDENQDRPWFAYLTHFAVHTPLHAKKELLDKYRDKASGSLHQHIEMATMIQAVDDGVGRIVEKLDELGLTDNTVIVFYSDNGGYGPATDMDPLKGYKGTYYEGGIRVPFFVNWPGKVSAGTKNAEPIIGVDLYPTFCAITEAELPKGQVLDGESLLPIFAGDVESLEERALFWHFPAYLQSYAQVWDEQRDPLFRSRPCSVIRKGHWKLHHYLEQNELELYNLEDDLGESKNLAEDHPEIASQLFELLDEWRDGTGADVPTEKNPEFNAEQEAQAIARKLAGQK